MGAGARAKAASYFHYRLGEAKILPGGAYSSVQIGDVVYELDIYLTWATSSTETLFTSLGATYPKICDPLDGLKSLIGNRKFTFLNVAYSDGIFVDVPIRIATKADTDQRAAIRTIHGDNASYFSTACAIACGGIWALCVHFRGILRHPRHMRGFHIVSAALFSLRALATGNEGGRAPPDQNFHVRQCPRYWSRMARRHLPVQGCQVWGTSSGGRVSNRQR